MLLYELLLNDEAGVSSKKQAIRRAITLILRDT